ncbi:hypothetical protein P7C70_g6130, partial [Phenoliferia sp. Uapishka_3]
MSSSSSSSHSATPCPSATLHPFASSSSPIPVLKLSHTLRRTKRRPAPRPSYPTSISSQTAHAAEPCLSFTSACGCFVLSPITPSSPPPSEHPAPAPATTPAVPIDIKPSAPYVLKTAGLWVESVFDGLLGYSIPRDFVRQGEQEWEGGYENIVAWRERVCREVGVADREGQRALVDVEVLRTPQL